MGLHRARMHTSFRQAWSGFLAGRCGEGPNVTSAGRRHHTTVYRGNPAGIDPSLLKGD
ncbi:hypothetical protein SAMN04487974_103205 [Pelagibacterium luteolum]|uniref:Uncharacterized protein n=1 Tax=Pelagibacterium luteolum TaxID=440168 RepID=A0A1G7UPY4_9HYPH|nr:hypothetical protein SAMN04487974_103205 [Pelagibacterium luteolum]